MELVRQYFPKLYPDQLKQLDTLKNHLDQWNQKINVISRKDLEYLEERHILHSLSIAKFINFKPGTRIIDVGTGGGFPGLPLAIIFPECHFTLVDSITKKIRVVNELAIATDLKNVTPIHERMEKIHEQFDFVVSRAVTAFPQLYRWTRHLVSKEQQNQISNGIIALKGGELAPEIAGFGKRIKVIGLEKWYNEPWFESKKLVYLGM